MAPAGGCADGACVGECFGAMRIMSYYQRRKIDALSPRFTVKFIVRRAKAKH